MTRAPLGGVLNRGSWTAEEDMLLKKYIEANGIERWSTLPHKAGLMRCGKSCRLRWMNHLRPNVKRGHISADEEDLIIRLHNLLGNRWSLIAGRVPGSESFSWGKAVAQIVEGQPLSCQKDSMALPIQFKQEFSDSQLADTNMKYGGSELPDSTILEDGYKIDRAEDQIFGSTGSIAPWVIEINMEEDIFLPITQSEQSVVTTDLCSDLFKTSSDTCLLSSSYRRP